MKTMPQHRHVIADLIRNPEGQGDTGEQDNTNQFPSPLMAEDQSLSQCLTLGAEGENDAPASSRHCGLDPQSRGARQD